MPFDTGVLGVYLLLLVGGGLFAAVAGMLSSWIDRKVTALVQARVGPPLLQPFYDFFKLMGKETVIPEGANRLAFGLMPLVALAAAALAAAILLGNVLWQNGLLRGAGGVFGYGLVGDLIVVLYLLAVPSLALVVGASSSNNPFASVGASREMKLMSYELPLLLTVAAALTLAAASERRFNDALQRQIDRAVPADSPLRSAGLGSGGPLAVAVPLRLDQLQALRSAGPDPDGKLLAGWGATRVWDLSRAKGRELRGQAEKSRGEAVRLRLKIESLQEQLRLHPDQADLKSRELAELTAAAGRAKAEVGRLQARAEGAEKNGDLISARLDGEELAAAVRPGPLGARVGLLALALCVAVAFFCAHAKLGLVPFDCAEAETEIAGGVLIEYGGPLLAIWKLTRQMLLFLLPVFIGMVFMGGFRFHVPGGGLGDHLGQAGVSLAKYVGILVVFTLVRNTNPRVRIDQAMRWFLGPMTTLAVVALILAVWAYSLSPG